MRENNGAFSDHCQTKNNALVVAPKNVFGMNGKEREFCIMKVVLN